MFCKMNKVKHSVLVLKLGILKLQRVKAISASITYIFGMKTAVVKQPKQINTFMVAGFIIVVLVLCFKTVQRT